MAGTGDSGEENWKKWLAIQESMTHHVQSTKCTICGHPRFIHEKAGVSDNHQWITARTIEALTQLKALLEQDTKDG